MVEFFYIFYKCLQTQKRKSKKSFDFSMHMCGGRPSRRNGFIFSTNARVSPVKQGKLCSIPKINWFYPSTTFSRFFPLNFIYTPQFIFHLFISRLSSQEGKILIIIMKSFVRILFYPILMLFSKSLEEISLCK